MKQSDGLQVGFDEPRGVSLGAAVLVFELV